MSDASIDNETQPSQLQLSSALPRFKKPPQAPKRFKSSFIFFSMEKHKQIKAQLDGKNKTIQVSKIVAEAWKNLTTEERGKWEDMANRDKDRYLVEKTLYRGPWKVPAQKRSPKDPNAPRRPMSAFLAYSNKRRGPLKQKNPQMGNAELSKTLAQMWKDAPNEQRQKYIEEELVKREAYKSAMAEWKAENAKEIQDQRRKREEAALRIARSSDYLPETSNHDGQASSATTGSERLRVSGSQHGDDSALLPPVSEVLLPRSDLFCGASPCNQTMPLMHSCPQYPYPIQALSQGYAAHGHPHPSLIDTAMLFNYHENSREVLNQLVQLQSPYSQMQTNIPWSAGFGHFGTRFLRHDVQPQRVLSRSSLRPLF